MPAFTSAFEMALFITSDFEEQTVPLLRTGRRRGGRQQKLCGTPQCFLHLGVPVRTRHSAHLPLIFILLYKNDTWTSIFQLFKSLKNHTVMVITYICNPLSIQIEKLSIRENSWKANCQIVEKKFIVLQNITTVTKMFKKKTKGQVEIQAPY